MRVIKFRGISTETGDWVYGNLIIDKGVALILNGVIESTDEYVAIEDWRPVEIESIGQYIGREDKTSTEIYEGDIVTCKMSFDNGSLPHMGEIVYVECFGSFATKNLAGETLLYNHIPSSFEIIGNIRENPRLLEG